VRRVRHVVNEIDRVSWFVALLEAGEVGLVGTLMNASHASLRDDYEVSSRELDLVVDTAREVQRERLLARDGISAALADSMIDAQASRERRLALADDVIVNDATLADTQSKVAALHARYVALGRERRVR
jgi:galactokinase